MTTITSASGSGTAIHGRKIPIFSMMVGEYPGETGDIIKTQDGQSATITSINYSTGRITVNKPIDWTNGEGIALYYQGDGPRYRSE